MRVPGIRLNQQGTDIQRWLASVGAARRYASRVSVLSQALCDDSLKLLEKQLPKPKSCDIIDINPGICVWSKAVHQLLQPRRHVLVEEDRESYAQYLDPLLQQDQSPYRYAAHLSTALDAEQGLLSNHVTQPAKVQLSKTLLIIANFTGPVVHTFGFHGTQGTQFLNDYYMSLFSQGSFIHRYGLVRLLIWVDDVTRRQVFTGSTCAVKRQHVRLDAAFKIQEIAGRSPYVPAKGFSWVRRWYELDHENYSALTKGRKGSRVEVPPHRQPVPGPPPLSYWKPTPLNLEKHRHLYPDHQQFIDRYLALDEHAAEHDPTWYQTYTRTRRGPVQRSAKPGRTRLDTPQTPEIAKFILSTNRLRTHYNNYRLIRRVIHQHRTMWLLLEKLFAQDDVDSPEYSARMTKLVTEWESLQERTDKMKLDNRILIEKAIDDYRAYDSKPRTLAWNRRTREPLVVEPTEFEPKRPLSLIYFQPRPEFLQQLNTADQQMCFDFIVQSFFVHPHDNIVQAVKRIMPAGWEELLETIPNLKNPVHGGFPLLDQLRIRSMPPQFFIDLAISLEKSPFRPSFENMIKLRRSAFDDKI